MTEMVSRAGLPATLPAPEFTPDQLQAGAADGEASDTFVIDNETLLDAIVQARKTAKELQIRSVDDRDPTLALRAHEVLGIGKSILERLLIAQGGQEALDELNFREHTAYPGGGGVTAVYPHH